MNSKRNKKSYKQEVIYVKKEENNYEEFEIPPPKQENNIHHKKKHNKKRDYNEEEYKELEIQPPPKRDEESLATILIQNFRRKKIDCPICYNRIASEARIWNCKQCFQPFHLSCISKWTQNSNLKKEKNQNILTWSCPKCCYLYTEKTPEYFCFCGKISNPEYDPFLLPHSCGEPCNKKRGSQCTHKCMMLCHPGPCPPCKMLEKVVNCYCGKNKYLTECGDETNNFECDQTCGKIMSCGKHACSKKCHKDSCEICTIKSENSCFCGKEIKIVNCGKENFSCNEICSKELDCKNHLCQQICHNGTCKECDLKPSKVLVCPCGKTQISTLMGENARKSCLDPIAVCGLPCGKLLPCKKHYCNAMCHVLRECPPCKEMVEQECRCQKKKRKIECWQTYQKNPEQFLCEKMCKKKKSCGIHACNTTCCAKDDINGNHLCLKVCGKKLNCGSHNCDLFCHLGFCKPCPIFIQQPITCVCGKTVLQPPLPCGTKRPSCHHPCSRVKLCGHPCSLECHEDPCPPCDFSVSKLCMCKRYQMNNVSCSKEASCGEPCDVILKCGHLCAEVCHPDSCPKESEDGCGKKCGKIRTDCKHKCLSLCHPKESECPKTFCQVMTKIKCVCGGRFGFVECGLAKGKIIKCDTGCKNKQRFGVLTEQDAYKKYSAILIRFAKNNLNFLQRLEQRIDQMVKNKEISFEIPIHPTDNLKIYSLEALIVSHYQMDIEFYLHVQNPYMVIISTQNMRIPRLKLSDNLRDIEKGVINNDILPFECSFKFYNPTKFNFYEDIENILQEEKINCVFEKKGEKTLMIHFWDGFEADFAAKKLKKRNYSNYQFETNMKLKSEEMKFMNYKSDISDIEVKEEKKEEEKSDL